MHLRKALMLSSQDVAVYKTKRHPGYREKNHYRVRVHMAEKERQSLSYVAPHLVKTTIYELAIYRDDEHHQNEGPTFAKEFADANALETFLSEWRFPIEDLWCPEEPEEQKPA